MCCSCGRSLNPSQRTKQLVKKNYDALFQVTSSKRTSSMDPNSELPSGNECTTRPRRCCMKLANPSMVVPKPFGKDGTRMTDTANLCQILGGLRSRLFRKTNLHWRTTLFWQQDRKELETRKIGYSLKIKKVFRDH